MARRKALQQRAQLTDATGRTCGRLPWDELTAEQRLELEAAHERARCLRTRGHGALPPGWLIGEGTFGEVFDRP